MAGFVRLSLVSCSSIGPATEKSKLQAYNAPFVQFWHKPFFGLLSLAPCSPIGPATEKARQCTIGAVLA